MSGLCSKVETTESSLSSALRKEQEIKEKVEERVKNIQLNIREIHEKMNKVGYTQGRIQDLYNFFKYYFY